MLVKLTKRLFIRRAGGHIDSERPANTARVRAAIRIRVVASDEADHDPREFMWNEALARAQLGSGNQVETAQQIDHRDEACAVPLLDPDI